MQEISPNVFIETGYAGVTLGAINLGHGLVLIDAPFLVEDIRSWRSSLLNLGGGVDRMLIIQDAHIDRMVGAFGMECTIAGHEDLAKIFQTRPFPYRSQSMETGAEWEMFDNTGTTRWAPPEISFTREMKIHWGESPIFLQHCPGIEVGAIWVHMPEERILFIGDLVIQNQPPFLANAHIPTWTRALEKLLMPEFRNYTLVGGRNGVIRSDQVRWQIRFLEKIQMHLEKLKEKSAPESEIEGIVPKLLQEIEYTQNQKVLFTRRLRWGLSMYYLKNYFPENLKESEE